MTTSTITICVPVYNGASFITECLESILSQEVDGLHILVSDNASTDGTVQQVKRLSDPRIELVTQPHNLGSHANFNWLLDHAEGDVVGTFCADDVMLPGHLQHQLAEMNRFPQARLYGCDMIVTDHSLTNGARSRLPSGIRKGRDLTRLSLRTQTNLYGGPSNFLWRGSEKTARYDPGYRWISDLKFAMVTVGSGLFYNTGRVGYLYRRHEASGTELTCPPEIRRDEWRSMLREMGGETSTISDAAAISSGSQPPELSYYLRALRWLACSPLNASVRRAVGRVQPGARFR